VTGQRRPGPSLALSLVTIGIGVAVGVVGLVETVTPFFRTLIRSTSYPTPATIHAHLSHGTYEIYQLTTVRTSTFSPIRPGTVDIQPDDVTVRSTSGASLTVTPERADETISRNRDVYTGAVQFAVPAAGDYVVTVRTDNGPATRVILARSLGSILRSVVAWVVTGAVGGVIFLIGLVLLIVGLVRRRQRPVQYAGGGPLPPAGWYPDPSDPSQQRYWDSHQWTDQTYRS
jgi:hypothetical protein